MATTEAISKAIASPNGGQLEKADRIDTILERIDVKKKFQQVLGDKAAAFCSSISSAVKANDTLKTCQPMSVVSSAFVAATLDLPINPSLGFAYIVPYREKGVPVAQFQMGWRGYVQLAIRTNQYKMMNVSEIYADEIEFWNPITGELRLTSMSDWKTRYDGTGKVIGYAAFYRTMHGFEKFLYMTTDQVMRHAKRYSKSFQSGFGPWKDDFDAMAKKTVLKMLLSKYGLLSIEMQKMQKALSVDQAVVDTEGEVQEYPDAIDAETVPSAKEPDESPVS